MYEAGQALLDEPTELKRQLPIAYVLEVSNVEVYQGEGKLHALCPFHNDHNPSFDVFLYGDVERFGCWVCGISGDVFDLMQKMWGIGFRQSLDWAKSATTYIKDSGWTPPILRKKFDWDESAALELLQKARLEPDDALQQLIDFKGWKFPVGYLRNVWDVHPLKGEVIVPYRNRTGRLVALKHRPSNGTRHLIALPGSELKNVVYGEFRILDERPILLCEGESDTWTARYFLGDRFNVFGIPTGAGSLPTRLDLFVGCDVVICFDSDDAGRMGAARWVDVLNASGAHATVYTLPGEDLASMPLDFLKGWA